LLASADTTTLNATPTAHITITPGDGYLAIDVVTVVRNNASDSGVIKSTLSIYSDAGSVTVGASSSVTTLHASLAGVSVTWSAAGPDITGTVTGIVATTLSWSSAARLTLLAVL